MLKGMSSRLSLNDHRGTGKRKSLSYGYTKWVFLGCLWSDPPSDKYHFYLLVTLSVLNTLLLLGNAVVLMAEKGAAPNFGVLGLYAYLYIDTYTHVPHVHIRIFDSRRSEARVAI